MKRLLIAGVLSLAVVLGPAAAPAAEFLVKPYQFKAQPGRPLPFSVLSCRVFMVSREMEPADQAKVVFLDADGSKSLELKPNETLKTLDGAAAPGKEGTAVLAGHRLPMIWTRIEKGWVNRGRKGLEGVQSSAMYEKFSKALVTIKAPGKGWDRVLGHALEIIPEKDPAEVHTGKDLAVKVLYDGKPLAVEVLATYDGFSDQADTWAYATRSDAEGRARIKITARGVWMARVEHQVAVEGEDYDRRVFRAVLLFQVD